HRPQKPYKPSPTPPPELNEIESKSAPKTTKFYPKTTTRPSILDLDQCKPACNAANKEICKEFDGKFKCDCRPGYIKKAGLDICHGNEIGFWILDFTSSIPFSSFLCFSEMQNFIVLVRLTRVRETEAP